MINVHLAADKPTIEEVKEILQDIDGNSKKIVSQNEELMNDITLLNHLYEQKIENIYKAKTNVKTNNFNISFWSGVLGIVATISSLFLAWRKDKRELIELKLKLEKQTI